MPDNELEALQRVRQVIYTTYALFPASATVGDLAYATDRLALYRWSGAAWQSITVHSSAGAIGDIPAIATMPEGSVYYATDTQVAYMASSGAWVQISSGSQVIVRKTADELVTNSTVLQNDDELLFPIAANEVWEFALLPISISATNTPDAKGAFTVPAGATIVGAYHGTNADGAVGVSTFVAAQSISFMVETSARVQKVFAGIVISGANAGNVQFQWAQTTATVEDTKILANSCIIAHRLA